MDSMRRTGISGNVMACSSSLKHTIGCVRLLNGGSHRLFRVHLRLADICEEEVSCRQGISLDLRQSDRRCPYSKLLYRLLNNHIRGICTLTELFSRLINLDLSSLLNNTIDGIN